MPRTIRPTLLLPAVMLISGCIVMPPAQPGSTADADDRRSPPPLKQMPPPPKPPAVPPLAAVPLDATLREQAKNEIINASRSADPVLRANAIESAQLGLGATEGASIILAGLKDNQPLARFAAAMAAGTLRLESARPLLLGLVDDEDETVRIGVRYALHKLGDKRRSHDLERTALSNDPRVRGTTAMVLGLLGEPSAVKVLRALQRDRDANVRLQAAEAMWRLGEQEGLESLVAVSIGQYPDDQMIAILAIAGTRNLDAARPYVRGKLTTQYPAVNLVAARAMGMLGSDEGFTLALQGAQSKEPLQRHLAALALGAIGRPDAQSALSRLLTDSDPSVRLAAAVGVLQLREAQ